MGPKWRSAQSGRAPLATDVVLKVPRPPPSNDRYGEAERTAACGRPLPLMRTATLDPMQPVMIVRFFGPDLQFDLCCTWRQKPGDDVSGLLSSSSKNLR